MPGEMPDIAQQDIEERQASPDNKTEPAMNSKIEQLVSGQTLAKPGLAVESSLYPKLEADVQSHAKKAETTLSQPALSLNRSDD